MPEVPSEGNRNLYALSQNTKISTSGVSEFIQNIETGEISYKVANVSDALFGQYTNSIGGAYYASRCGVKIPVIQGKDVLVSLTDDKFIKNYVMFWGEDNKLVKSTVKYTSSKFKVPASYLEGVSYVTMRFGIKENTQEIGTLIKTKVKVEVEYGGMYTEWSPAPEDLGWTTDTLVPTQEKPYLWKFEYVYFSDGSVEVTQPTNISIAGADGTNGQTSHVHFAFADNATGGGFSLTTTKAYMGWYADFNESASNDPTKYKWTKVEGPKGDKGATGDRGPQGIQGIQGPKGDQGIQGPKGADGKTQYTHIAYADNATGGGFSQTDQTKAYIGMYVDFNATDSTDPTKYRWSKWHGDKGATGAQGIQGPKGADGRTPYLHIAYANSADGRTDFSTSNSGNKRYLGTYTDYTQTDSTDPTKYKWVDMVGTVKVGGRNLAQKTSKDWSKPFTGFSGVQNTCINLYKVITDGLVVGDTIKVRIILKYTDIVPASEKTAKIWLQGAGNVTQWGPGGFPSAGGDPHTFSGSGEIVFETSDKIVADHLKNDYWSWAFRTDWIASGSLEWKEAKVEAGTVFSKWSPAFEDTQEQIDSKADQALTQQQLNALAEQNSIVKAEMEAKASIDTVNQWITAYQNYVNANDEAKAESERNLQEASARILQLKTDVGTLRQQWDFIDTYMTVQNEGLIIGKSDGSAYAKFANDRISLFSGSSEVMYISQGVLRIENGIFTKTIQIGRFRFETHPADADMLVLRYLGG